MTHAAPAPASSVVRGVAPAALSQFYAHFRRLGAMGFGGPLALAGFMQRDLVEERRLVSREDHLDGLALGSELWPIAGAGAFGLVVP